jgi:hypothetical protein
MTDYSDKDNITGERAINSFISNNTNNIQEAIMKLHRLIPMLTATLLLGIYVSGFAAEKQLTGNVSGQNIVQYKPGLKTSSLAALPNTALVEIPNGRRVSVGTIRNLENAAKIMRTSRINHTPATLKYLPDRNNIAMQVKNATDLTAALKLPDNATIKFPSGRVATAGQIKFVKPLIEKRLGRPLTALPQRPNLSGPAIKIPENMSKSMSKSEQQKFWEDILQKPDSTVLESSHGKRITVAELKKEITKNNKSTNSKTSTRTALPQFNKQGGAK